MHANDRLFVAVQVRTYRPVLHIAAISQNRRGPGQEIDKLPQAKRRPALDPAEKVHILTQRPCATAE